MKTIPSKKEQLVNTKTGEVVTSIAIIPEARDKNFVKVFKLMSSKVIEDLKEGINGAVYTLFWFINKIQGMEPNQNPTVYADPADIMNDLDVSRRTAFRHLKLLKEYGYIQQIKQGQHVYRINPEMVFKGTLTKYFEDGNRKKQNKVGQDSAKEFIKPKTKASKFTVDAVIVEGEGDSNEE